MIQIIVHLILITQHMLYHNTTHLTTTSALEPIAHCYVRHQCQHVGLFQTTIEDAHIQ